MEHEVSRLRVKCDTGGSVPTTAIPMARHAALAIDRATSVDGVRTWRDRIL
jgi:hypothetical protein